MKEGASDPHGVGLETYLEVTREQQGSSLLKYLDALAGPLDRRLVASAAKEGAFLLNGEPAGPSVTLRMGDQVHFNLDLAELSRTASEALVLLHEDDDFLVAAKPSGLPFDASRAGSGRSAVERMASFLPPECGRLRPVHRLDKDTSGLVVTAKNRAAEERLAAAFRAGEARMEYLAVIRRELRETSGRMDVSLGKRRKSDAKMIADPKHGRPSVTEWALERRFRGYSLLRLWATDTGRSHQIRAHLALSGHPVACDKLYGEDDRVQLSQLKLKYRPKRGQPERAICSRPALHATRFCWGSLVVEAPVPDDLAVFLAQLERHCAHSSSETSQRESGTPAPPHSDDLV